MDEMEILWIPDNDFKLYIDQAGAKASLENVNGRNRWVITPESGHRYIVRPESAKNQANEQISTTESA